MVKGDRELTARQMNRTWIALLIISQLNSLSGCRVATGKDVSYDVEQEKALPDGANACSWQHPWLQKDSAEAQRTIRSAISPPAGFVRMDDDGLSEWLRCLPLKEQGSRVHLYDGSLKYDQDVSYAVLDVDVGHRDLQQCADAAIRLHAEYLLASNQKTRIAFNFTSGDRVPFSKWMAGYRPIVSGNSVRWRKDSGCDSSYSSFRKYLDIVFTYAGTASLEQELEPVHWEDMQPGDIIIKGGHPGHAVTLVDVAVSPATGEKVFLIAQSYMPAQEIHILVNENEQEISPWYSTSHYTAAVPTPEWQFTTNNLRRFRP